MVSILFEHFILYYAWVRQLRSDSCHYPTAATKCNVQPSRATETPSVEKHAHPPRVVYCAIYLTLTLITKFRVSNLHITTRLYAANTLHQRILQGGLSRYTHINQVQPVRCRAVHSDVHFCLKVLLYDTSACSHQNYSKIFISFLFVAPF